MRIKDILVAGALTAGAVGCVSDSGPDRPNDSIGEHLTELVFGPLPNPPRPTETVAPQAERPEPTCAEQIAELSTGVQDQTVVAAYIAEACEGSNAHLAVDIDGDEHVGPADCVEGEATIHVGAVELCNGIDDNCNGVIDDVDPSADRPAGELNRPQLFAVDADGDGYTTVLRPYSVPAVLPEGFIYACEAPEGYIQPTHFIGDCNDADASIHFDAFDYPMNQNAAFPYAPTMNRVDDNCDGIVDGGFPNPIEFYLNPIPVLNGITEFEGTTPADFGTLVHMGISDCSLNSRGREAHCLGVAVHDYLGDAVNSVRSAVYRSGTAEHLASMMIEVILVNNPGLNTPENAAMLNKLIEFNQTMDLAALQAELAGLEDDRYFLVVENQDIDTTELQRFIFRQRAAGLSQEAVDTILRGALEEFANPDVVTFGE